MSFIGTSLAFALLTAATESAPESRAKELDEVARVATVMIGSSLAGVAWQKSTRPSPSTSSSTLGSKPVRKSRWAGWSCSAGQFASGLELRFRQLREPQSPHRGRQARGIAQLRAQLPGSRIILTHRLRPEGRQRQRSAQRHAQRQFLPLAIGVLRQFVEQSQPFPREADRFMTRADMRRARRCQPKVLGGWAEFSRRLE